MTRLDEAVRRLDPVDPDAPAPADEALLERILQTPYGVPQERRTRRVRRAPLALLGVACGVAAALLVALPHGGRTDALAAAYHALTRPHTILHYRQHWWDPGTRISPRQDGGTIDVWQASDGSRERQVAHLPGLGPWEQVWTHAGTRTWAGDGENRIITYDARHAGRPPRAGSLGLNGSGGPDDPAALLRRASDGDSLVTRLPDATVRGIPVIRFRVGRCHATGTRFKRQLRLASVVSLGKESHLPIRVEQPPCRKAPPGQVGLKFDEMPGPTVDYVHFEVLPADRGHRRLLDMSPHPGAKIVDGAAIDRAEARADRRRGDGPTPSPTPTPSP
jgi:hypothetical protein